MSDEFERNAGGNDILPTVPSTFAEQAATTAVLEDLRQASQKIVEGTVGAARDAQRFSWDVDPQDMARALTTGATLPSVIWSMGTSLANSLWLTPIDFIGRPATPDR